MEILFPDEQTTHFYANIYLNLRNLTYTLLGTNFSIREIPERSFFPFFDNFLKKGEPSELRSLGTKPSDQRSVPYEKQETRYIAAELPSAATFGSSTYISAAAKEAALIDAGSFSKSSPFKQNCVDFNNHYLNMKNYLQNCQEINVSSNKWQIIRTS